MTAALLRLTTGNDIEWMDDNGVVRMDPPVLSPNARAIVLVPAEDVLLLEVAKIAGSKRQWSKAIPFLIEDSLILPIEAQHVAWKWDGGDNSIIVCVATHARMEAWLARLRDANIDPDALIPESLALPVTSDAPSVMIDGDRCLLRRSNTQAITGTVDEIVAIVEHTKPVLDASTWLVGESSSPFPAHSRTPIVHALHAYSLRDDMLNLLQGAYTPRKRLDGQMRYWRQTAMLAATALLLLLMHAVVDRQKLAGKVSAQRQEMERLYRDAVPGATVADDPARRLRSVLSSRGLRQDDGALRMLSKLAPTIAAADRLSINSIEYRERRLELIVQASDVRELDRLERMLVRTGLDAEIVSTTPGTAGIEGRLSMREAR